MNECLSQRNYSTTPSRLIEKTLLSAAPGRREKYMRASPVRLGAGSARATQGRLQPLGQGTDLLQLSPPLGRVLAVGRCRLGLLSLSRGWIACQTIRLYRSEKLVGEQFELLGPGLARSRLLGSPPLLLLLLFLGLLLPRSFFLFLFLGLL